MKRHPVISQDLADITSDPALDFSSFRGKTFLVSGASGFLPAYMVETLLYLNDTRDLGIRVIGLVRDLEKARARFAAYEGRPDLRLGNPDLGRKIEIDGPVQILIHAAAQSSPRFFGQDPVGTLSLGLFGTHHLLELAAEKKAEDFFFFSSSEVYGRQEETIREDSFGPADCLQVRACYAESKRAGEAMCAAWAHQFGLPVKIVRPFHVYGPGMSFEDGRVFADFVADIVNRRNLVIRSDGRALRSFCYLSDAVRAFFLVLLKGKRAEAYNVGNDEEVVSIAELAQRLVNAFPDRKLELEFQPPPAGSAYLPSPMRSLRPETTKIRALGWEPRVSIEAGFQRAVSHRSI